MCRTHQILSDCILLCNCEMTFYFVTSHVYTVICYFKNRECDGSRKDQLKCTDNPLSLEFYQCLSHLILFNYFLRLLNMIFTMQIVCSAWAHWVQTFSVFSLSGTFLFAIVWNFFSKDIFFLLRFLCCTHLQHFACTVCHSVPASHFV